MKRILYLFLLHIFSVFSGFPQIDSAKIIINSVIKEIDSKNFRTAISEIDKAKQKITNELCGRLTKALPDKVAKWHLQLEVENGDFISTIPNGSSDICVSGYYIPDGNPKFQPQILPQEKSSVDSTQADGKNSHQKNDDTIISISITNNYAVSVQYINEFDKVEKLFSGKYKEENNVLTAMRIKKHRAILWESVTARQFQLDVIIGGGMVELQGNNIDNSDMLLNIVDEIDFNIIKSILGE